MTIARIVIYENPQGIFQLSPRDDNGQVVHDEGSQLQFDVASHAANAAEQRYPYIPVQWEEV